MSDTGPFAGAGPRLRTPSGLPRGGQPWWNPQRASAMPAARYLRGSSALTGPASGRQWPDRVIEHSPLWCSVDLRDGNQALANPMNPRRKGLMFDLLVEMGFKEIEVGYPSASDTDFSFVRDLIRQDKIPDDVTISVFTPARPDLIDRTFEAIRGLRHGMVHLCLATACLWRDVVFQMSRDELQALTVASASQVARLAAAMPHSNLRFEYSPETFNVTEPDFALAISDSIVSVWDASPDRPVTLNLPSTVETDTPNVFADQIEWMHNNLGNRRSIILSVHPHNDRGTAVASAELALMAGADRVEGTLFGNGERTGNVCLATLALNLFSHGVDPQLDFSDIDYIRGTVEVCNQMPVPARHPYAGDLVYTAFSGTHQDAIAKGLAARDARAASTGQDQAGLPWEVPYLPIDPKDVGRSYQSVIRVNSQSGKGGVAHVLKSSYGLDLPRALRIELSALVQKTTDESGAEINSRQLWDIFRTHYLEAGPSLRLEEFTCDRDEAVVSVGARLRTADGRELAVAGTGDSPAAAFAEALVRGGWAVQIRDRQQHPVPGSGGTRTAVYAHVEVKGNAAWGAGLDGSPDAATLAAILVAVGRAA